MFKLIKQSDACLRQSNAMFPIVKGMDGDCRSFMTCCTSPKTCKCFGCPQNWDASPGEHNVIDFAKCPAQRTQKRHSTFMEQVAQHLHEFCSIKKVYDTIRPPTKSPLPSMGSDKDDDASHMQSKLVGHHFATIHIRDGCRVEKTGAKGLQSVQQIFILLY